MSNTTKAVSKWSDGFMFTAEESIAAEGPKVFLLGAPTDPLGQIAACAKMYKGEVVRDLRDVTDEERRSYLREIQKTVLKMPLEAVSMHFMVEGVTRGFTHQMVRQRTAAFAQESTRFAVKEDMKTATALPPSLEGTKSLAEAINAEAEQRHFLGLSALSFNELENHVWDNATGAQRARMRWDQAVDSMGDAYLDMVNDGIPAEDARGLLPTNITTRLNYITNLRSWYDTMAVRVSDQAQFEWRQVAMHMALAMRTFGAQSEYQLWLDGADAENFQEYPGFADLLEYGEDGRILIAVSSLWQYEALSNELKPIEFKIGGPAFGADFDRPSRIGERVREFHKYGVPSSEWTTGSVEHGIPPIHPDEWLMDPASARLSGGEEFDVFGNRVPVGTGLHFVDHGVIGRSNPTLEAHRWPRDFVGEMAHYDAKPEPTEDEVVDAEIVE